MSEKQNSFNPVNVKTVSRFRQEEFVRSR